MKKYDELDEDFAVSRNFIFLLRLILKFLVLKFAGFFLYLLLFLFESLHIFKQDLLDSVMLDTLIFHFFVVLIEPFKDMHDKVG